MTGRLLTLVQAAESLAVSPRTVQRLAASGAIQPVRLSARVVRYQEADLARLVRERSQPSSSSKVALRGVVVPPGRRLWDRTG